MVEAKTSEYRLPGGARPIHYDLVIKTDPDKLTFEGWVHTTLNILQGTATLKFNLSPNLKVSEITLTCNAWPNDTLEPSEPLAFDKKTEIASVVFPKVLPEQSQAVLSMRFGSQLNEAFLGYAQGVWKKPVSESDPESGSGEVKYAATFFAPTFARQVFPCWDEPALKATFSVRMISPKENVNLCNMPIVSEEEFDPVGENCEHALAGLFKGEEGKDKEKGMKWKITRFDKTPPMPTYLLAFATGPFDFIETSYTSPITGKVRPLRFYATPDIVAKGQYCLDIKARALEVYEKLFEIEFPLPKLDTLAIPESGPSAMETWGLIITGTDISLYEPGKTTENSKRIVAVVEAHEVAHQWFGNIVTMQWWDNTWLNEGFATLIGEMIGMDKIEPDWNVYAEFTKKIDIALDLDSKRSSHPVQLSAESPGEIGQSFDQLSYSKAASVLRMLSEYAGEEKFLKGVSLYLNKHLYGNATAEDLWEGIREATGFDIPTLLAPWIHKTGYPVLRVTETENGVHVRQDRFLEAEEPNDEENQTTWHVPLFVVTRDESGNTILDRGALLTEKEADLQIDPSRQYLINGGKRGYYRVLYPTDRLRKNAEGASNSNSLVTLEDRIGLLSDTLAFSVAGLQQTSVALGLCEEFKWDRTYLGCNQLARVTKSIRDALWEDSELYTGLEHFRKTLFRPHIERLGVEKRPNDTNDEIQIRALAVEALAEADEPWVVKELQNRFKKFMETYDPGNIPTDLLPVAFQTAIRHGGVAEWELALRVLKDPNQVTLKSSAMRGLAGPKDPALIERSLKLIPDGVGGQDIIWYLKFITTTNVAARRPAFEFVLKNFDMLESQVGSFMVTRLLLVSFSSFSSVKDADEMDTFFKARDTSNYWRALEPVLEATRVKAAWVKRAKKDVRLWLERFGFLKGRQDVKYFYPPNFTG